MPSEKIDPLDQVFMALADKTRREMVHRLTSGEKTISELTDGLDMSLAAASKHIKMLEKARIVKRRIEGRIHNISLVPEQLGPALDWISIYRNFWQSRFNQLSDLLNDEDNGPEEK